MADLDAWIERIAASSHSVLKSFGTSLAIVIIGFFGFQLALEAVVHFRHLTMISFDPREDPWFRYLGFVAPTALTLLALATFHIPLSIFLIRNHRYPTFVSAPASGTVVGLSFFFFMVFCWIMY